VTTTAWTTTVDLSAWREQVVRRCEGGDRFAGLFATAEAGQVRLTAVLAAGDHVDLLDAAVREPARAYPALTPLVPAAFWYEREIADLFGLRPQGHPRLDPLILPLTNPTTLPRPGAPGRPAALTPHEQPLPVHLAGDGLFTLTHGPVRSGVTESVEFLIETPGENIPHLRIRPHAKHRGVEKRFETLDPGAGVWLAERSEGIASVAHATAYASAIEALAELDVPRAGGLIRLVHAELERIANHLDVAMRLADAAALAVAVARFGWHKEQVLRLRSALCGSRYGRGVVRLGGVTAPLRLGATEAARLLDDLQRGVEGDVAMAMTTASFLDRLRNTGPLPVDLARRHGALGPIGRASGAGQDVRVTRPYDAYRHTPVTLVSNRQGQDTQARLLVRCDEIAESFRLIRRALAGLAEYGRCPAEEELRRRVESIPDGRALGWAEAPQGEVLYLVETSGGRLVRVKPRSASFHNLPLFHAVFAGDIFTDFAFIEAGFGLSIAGVAL
jgi:Ni,Fe-hydrogenase III large subunit